MSIGCLGILLGAISGAGAIRDNGRMLGALDDLLTELEHDFSSLEVHVKSHKADLQTKRLHGPFSEERNIKKVESPSVDDASMKSADLDQLQREVEEEDWRRFAAGSPVWRDLMQSDLARGIHLFQKLVEDREEHVRTASAASPAWVPLLEKNFSKGTELFHQLAGSRSDSSVRKACLFSPAWAPLLDKDPSKAIELFQQLIGDSQEIRRASAGSPAWVPLLEKNFSKGTELFHQLVEDEYGWVRGAIAESPAWVPLLEKNLFKGTELFQKLVEDPDDWVRRESAGSPVWVPLLEKDLSRGTELFQKLVGDRNQNVSEQSARSPAWVPLLKADKSKWIQSFRHFKSPTLAKHVCNKMTERQDTSVNHYFQNFSTVELLEAAQLLSEASADCMAKLGFTVALTERVRDSWDSSFLSKLLEVQLWAKLAGRRLVHIAEEAKEEAKEERDLAEAKRHEAEEAKEYAEEQKEKAKLEREIARIAGDEAEAKRYDAEEAKKSAERSKNEAEKQKKKAEAAAEEVQQEKETAESQREIAVMLVIALLALGTLTVFSGILWYFYPAICQWRDESLGRCDCWRFKLHAVPITLWRHDQMLLQSVTASLGVWLWPSWHLRGSCLQKPILFGSHLDEHPIVSKY